MNIHHQSIKKIATYISAVFYFFIIACFAQAQSRMPTQKDIDAMNALLKKVPTPEQDAEFSKITEAFDKKYTPINSEVEKLLAEIEHVMRPPGYLLTKAHVQAAMINHKKLRALYIELFNAIADWGLRSGRVNCTRQAEKMRLYTIRVSNQWLAKAGALPMATIEDKDYAALYIGGGGGRTFQPDIEAMADIKHMVFNEIVSLYGVCNGSRAEYVPGAE